MMRGKKSMRFSVEIFIEMSCGASRAPEAQNRCFSQQESSQKGPVELPELQGQEINVFLNKNLNKDQLRSLTLIATHDDVLTLTAQDAEVLNLTSEHDHVLTLTPPSMMTH